MGLRPRLRTGVTATRRALRNPAALLFDAPDAGSPLQSGRLGALLFLAGFLDVALSSPFLPMDVDRSVVYLLVAAAGLTAVVLALVPWARLPDWAPLAPALWVCVLLAIGGYYGGALDHYQAFYPVAFLYVGLTQPPGRSLAFGGPAVLSALVAVAGRQPAEDLIDFVGAIAVGVVLGELLAQLTVRTRTSRRSIENLLLAVTSMNAAPDQATGLDTVEQLTRRLLQADGGMVMLEAHDDDSRVSQAIREGRPIFVPDTAVLTGSDADGARRLKAASLLYVPLSGESGPLGVAVAWWTSPRTELGAFHERVATLLGQQAGEALSRLQSVGRLEVQARTDALTGLGNRRALVGDLARLPVGGTVVMFDLDHFKSLNDTHGHAAGDRVLRLFADTLRHSLRDGDAACRYGGEEFALVLGAGGEQGAESVLARVNSLWLELGTPRTWSAGIAVHRPDETATATLARADAAMYEAKRTGRDRTVVAA